MKWVALWVVIVIASLTGSAAIRAGQISRQEVNHD